MNNRPAWLALPPILLVLLAGVQLAHGGVFYAQWAQDIFIPLEGVVHLQHGQWPHRDFGTPVGALYYAIHYLPTLVAPLSARTIVHANLLVALTASLATLRVGRSRLPLWATTLAAVYVGLLALSPRQLGKAVTDITYNAAYNRYGWSLICVLALVAMLPRPTPTLTPTRAQARDGAATAILLALLFTLKITYFAAGAALVAIAMVTVRRRASAPFGLAALAVFAAAIALFEVTTGLLAPYFADLRNAALVLQGSARTSHVAAITLASLPGGVLVVLLARQREGGLRGGGLPVLAAALATVFAGLAIGMQNHHALENPLVPIALLIAWFGARPPQDTARTPRNTLACVAIAAGFMVPLTMDTAASVYAGTAPAARGGQVDWLATTPLRDLRLMDVALPPQGAPTTGLHSDVAFAAVLFDGVTLLRRHLHGSTTATVLPLTWSNPFPLLLGLPPVRHELAWWDRDRTFDLRHKPDPATLLAGVDYVMIPTRYFNLESSRAMRAAYAAALNRDFRPAGRSRFWLLLARRDCAARERCQHPGALLKPLPFRGGVGVGKSVPEPSSRPHKNQADEPSKSR